MPNQNQEILFYLPITKQWLEQYALVHFQQGTSYRGVIYSFETLFDLKRSIGWCHNTIYNAAGKAQILQATENLSKIEVSANDEVFDGSKPILTSVCTNSLYCPLLKKSDDRKAETWEEVLKELMNDHGYNPHSCILDGSNSLQAGHKQALENATIIYDIFHITSDFKDMRRFVNNQLKSTKTNLNTIVEKLEKAKHEQKIQKLKRQKVVAQRKYNKALNLYQTIATLDSWFQHDILKVAGYDYQTRYELLRFMATELELVEKQMPHRIQPVRKTLQNKADKILGFVKNLETELVAYAELLGCDVYWLWKLCYAQRYDKNGNSYYQYILPIMKRLKHKFYEIENTVIAIMNEIEKASSVVENLNGRIRKFLMNHVHVSQDVLELLRLIINHREFERSRCEHRQGKSPAQVLHEQNHPHWLEMLGYKLFKQAA
jgi:hypothetical protein